MPHEGLLISLSQTGAVFAGFMAIFIAFIRRDGRLERVTALRARSILYSSVVTIFAALFPMVLFATGLDEDASWRVGALLSALIGAGLSLEGARHQLALSPEEQKATGLIFNMVSWGIPAIALAIGISVAVAWLGPEFYVLAVTLMLVVSALNFVKISLERFL